MEPPVIPAEKSPRRRQMDVTGGRENVRGKRSTIPKEMVRPGDAPMKSPKRTPDMDAKRFWILKTSSRDDMMTSLIGYFP
jgi:hypothetical protein